MFLFVFGEINGDCILLFLFPKRGRFFFYYFFSSSPGRRTTRKELERNAHAESIDRILNAHARNCGGDGDYDDITDVEDDNNNNDNNILYDY